MVVRICRFGRESLLRELRKDNFMEQLEQFIDSREVAEMVGKQHNELLKDIRRYAGQLGEGNIPQSDFFTESTYVNSQNKKMPCYQVTKKGCEFIAHKLTGVKGTEFTAKYINRFHEMEDAIKSKVPSGAELIALAVVEAQKLLEAKEQEVKELQGTVQQMDLVIADMTPKVDYVDRILSSKDSMTVTQIAQEYGMTAVRFNNILAVIGIQRKVGSQWILYSEYQGKGYVQNKTYDYEKTNGATGTRTSTVWTQKGRMFLYEKLKAEDILPDMEVVA
nr:MAG TPA: antirepressor protein [Bacteriophage sp.]